MKIFVTGPTGFIGSHFLNAAMIARHEVVALRRSSGSLPHTPTIEPLFKSKRYSLSQQLIPYTAAYCLLKTPLSQWSPS